MTGGSLHSALLLLEFAERWRLGQRENDQFLAGRRADIVMQTDWFDAGNIRDECFKHRPRRFDQLGSHLFEQVASLVGRQRLNEMLLGRGENTFQANDEQVIDEVGTDMFRTATHEFLLETRHPFTDGRLNFAECFHGRLERVPRLLLSAAQFRREFAKRDSLLRRIEE
jgi:hypothetical protein